MSNPNLPVIGLDLDGVCADFTTAVRIAYREDFGVLIGESTHWNYILDNTHFENWPAIYEWLRGRDHFWYSLPEYDGARNAVRAIIDRGFPIIIVTHRPDWGQEDTVAWVERFWPKGYDKPSVFLAYDKTTVPFDILIDDGPHNAEAMDAIGRTCLLFDQPWNQGVIETDNVIRTRGWDEVETWLEYPFPVMAPPIVVGMAGYAQAGKDSAGRVLVKSYGFERLAFADILREVLYKLNPIVRRGNEASRVAKLVDSVGWEEAKRWTEVRALLQRLGTEAGRDVLGQDVWVNAVMAKIKPGGKYVITDVRFPNEADAIKALGGEVWRVIRRGDYLGAPGSVPANDHPSETALNDYVMDRGLIAGNLRELVFAVQQTFDAAFGSVLV